MAHKTPDLKYAYDALEPYIDAQTMKIHHDLHHAAYVAKLNAALDKHSEYRETSIEKILSNINELPEDIRQTVINNGGGHANHSLFWTILKKNNGKKPSGDMLRALEYAFGSYENFTVLFTDTALNRFGSGWAWLTKDKKGTLEVFSTPNQDSPLMTGKIPIIGLDVWEHAYYLKYQNRRPDYIKAFWNVLDWEKIKLND